jgi:predicted MFS family arabinose efflux permease
MTDIRRAIAIVACNFAVVFISAMLPTPLYSLYRETFEFGAITLTFVYAVYVLGNMLALLVFGRLADQIGRRRVAISATFIAIVCAVVFLLADSTGWLFLARILSGLATGLVAGTSAAWLAELFSPERRSAAALVAGAGNFMGLALGPLLGGVLATFAPWPLRLSYIVYIVLLALSFVATCTVPETVQNPRKRWSELSLKPRFGVPGSIRSAFLSPAITGFATFSLIGFYGALIPGMVAESLRVTSPLVSGALVFELFVVATITLAVSARLMPRTAMLGGLILLPISLWLLMLAEHLKLLWLIFVATESGGIAAALGYRGSLQVVNAIAPADRRSEVVSVFMFVLFAGNAIPVIGIAVLTAATTPSIAHATFASVITMFAIFAFVMGKRMIR